MRDSFGPRSPNLLGEDSTCMLNRLEIPRVIDWFFFLCLFYYMLLLFHKIRFVLSNKHKNQNVATIDTLLDHIHVEL